MKALLPALLSFSLAACTAFSPAPNPRAGRPPAYQGTQSQAYSGWVINTSACRIQARSSEFTLTTDGRIKDGTLSLRATFLVPIVGSPLAELSALPVPIPVEGAAPTFSIILAFEPTTIAHMLQPDTYLMLNYQPITSLNVVQSSISTAGLMLALSQLSNSCPS